MSYYNGNDEYFVIDGYITLIISLMIDDFLLLKYAKETLNIEIKEAQGMLERLDERSIITACRILLDCEGKIVVFGIGKSGHIGKKIAASLASTGTPAFFVHPSEALHGDLGSIESKDVAVFISYSGRTYELITLIPLLKDNAIPVVILTGDVDSPLAKLATCVLNTKIQREACPMNLTPTSSTINTLMLGDALTISVMRYRGFNMEQFARLHPGGRLGAKLWHRVYHVMRTGERVAKVFCEVTVMDAMFELSRTGLGLTVVCDNDIRVVGIFTDGDLRRWIVQGKSLHASINTAMTKPVYSLSRKWKANIVLKELYKRNITAAPVINDSGILVGSINIDDLYNAGF